MFDYQDTPYTVVNVYGPNDDAAATQFYTDLAQMQRPSGQIIVGGDFNVCTHEKDRTNGVHPSNRTAAFDDWVEAWSLADTVSAHLIDDQQTMTRAEFAGQYHTYFYTNNGQPRSSRLDRYYVAEDSLPWVADTRTHAPGAPSDHRSVTLLLLNPAKRVPVARQRRTLASGTHVRELQTAGVAELLLQCTEDFQRLQTENGIIGSWERLKKAAMILCCRIASQARKKQRVTYRQRVRTLGRQLHKVAESFSQPHHRPDAATAPGMDDLQETARRLQQRITIIRQQRAQHMVRRNQNRYRGRSAPATKAFFSGFSTKYDASGGYDFGDSKTTAADAVAEAWRPIMQTPRRSTGEAIQYLNECEPRRTLAEHHATALTRDISEAEVRVAIRRCQRGKACGPDALPNDWFRDHEELLIPFLTKLFNCCLRHTAVPQSFQAANIFCLPKVTNPQSGLDFRPLALLNADYKIFTRIFSIRLRTALPSLLHEHQTGFVPHRTIHDTIALLRAFQDPQQSTRRGSQAAMMLDFRKAYDTLDRTFLIETLNWLKFPTQFVELVDRLHQDTSARFLLNGLHSRTLDVHSGIRQGCPLAPLLFVIAMEPLYRRIELHPNLCGVSLPCGHNGHIDLRIAGYADDTTIYTADEPERAIVTDLLHCYGAVAGLHINAGKTVLLPAETEHEVTSTTYKIATDTEIIRYLGIPIMLRRDTEKIWHHIMAQVRVRLALALKKTTNVTQRAQLAAAIVVAKIKFVCRHEWPSKKQLESIQRFLTIYVWNGHFDVSDRSRSWLKAALACRSPNDGGLGLPDLKAHLMAMAATTVYTQANIPPCRRVAHSRSLAPACIIQPHRTAGIKPKYLDTIFLTGANVIACHEVAIRTGAERNAIHQALASLSALRFSQRHWQRARLWVDTSVVRTELSQVNRASRDAHGRLNAAWLEHCEVGVGGFLLGEDGTEITPQQIDALGGSSKLSQLIHWRRESDTLMSFAPRGVSYPLTNTQAVQFDVLVNSLLANYPGIARQPVPHNQLLVDGEVDLDYSVHEQPNRCTLHIKEWPNPQPQVRVLPTASHARMWIRRRDKNAEVGMIPALTSVVQLYVASSTPTMTYGRVYNTIIATDDEVGAPDFDDIDWTDIHNHPVATAAERLTMLKLKLGRLTLHVSGRIGPICPHTGCTEVRATIDHVLWACPVAHTIWEVIWHRWRPLFEWTTRREMQLAALSWKPGRFPRKWRTNLSALRTCRSPPDPKRTLQTIWSAEAIAAMHMIYRVRIAALNLQVLAAPQIETALHRHLRQIQWVVQGQRYGDAARELYTLMHAPDPLPCVPDDSPAWILFFDGGARGNPGPAGAGSVLLRPHLTTYDIVWIGTEFYAAPTTNNYAEFAALRNGIHAATRHAVTSLHVVGDSQLIIHMHQQMCTPRAPHLRKLHDETVAALDSLQTVTWQHHVRDFNKMADCAANWAMDQAATSTSTHPYTALYAAVQQHMAGDIGHWSERRSQDIGSTS